VLRCPSLTRVQPHPVFFVGGGEAERPSQADPSTTHVMLSAVDEPCVTNVGDATAGLVSDHSWLTREADTYGLAVWPVFFAYFLCGVGPRK
jgi:hypothetical protein